MQAYLVDLITRIKSMNVNSFSGDLLVITMAFSILYIILSEIVSLFRKHGRKNDNCIMLLVALNFSAFGVVIIGYIQQQFKSYLSVSNLISSIPELSIANMQAGTLAITTLVVTITGVVLTMLSILRDHKTTIAEKTLDEAIEKVREIQQNAQKAEIQTQELSDIASLVFINEHNREYYYDLLMDLVEKKDSKQSNNHLALRVSMQIYASKKVTLEKKQEILEDIETKTRNVKSSDPFTCDFLQLSRLYALYELIAIRIQHVDSKKEEEEKQDIKDLINNADALLKRINKKKYDDAYGHIANMKGLVHLWTGIAESRYELKLNSRSSVEKCLSNAVEYFEKAVKKNNNDKFKNHLCVALMQLRDFYTNKNNNKKEEIEKRLEEQFMHVNKDICTDGKLLYNKTAYNIEKMKQGLGIKKRYAKAEDALKDLTASITKVIKERQVENTLKQCQDIYKQLLQARRLRPHFVNIYYQMIFVQTIRIALKGEQELQLLSDGHQTESVSTLIKEAKYLDSQNNTLIFNIQLYEAVMSWIIKKMNSTSISGLSRR